MNGDDMELLPPEIKSHVFSFLNAGALSECVSKVCSSWEAIASRILEERIAKMLEELSSNPGHLEEIKLLLIPQEREDNKKILQIYEKAFLNRSFGIGKKHLGDGVLDFLVQVRDKRGCDCHKQNLCIIRSLHYMPCHRLLLVQTPEKIEFHSMSSLNQDGGGEWGRSQYKTSVFGPNTTLTKTNVWIDNNTHTAVSVFNDKIVGQETTRALILFRVKQVDHLQKTVVLEQIRRIFLPLWSCDLVMLENMVCCLFTTGSVGIWRMKEDSIQVSENSCVDALIMRNMQLTKMYLCKNLVIIKIVTDNSSHWSIFDSDNTEVFQVQSFDLNTFIKNSFLNSSDTCSKVLDIFVTLNAFIVHCQVITSLNMGGIDKHSKGPNTTATYREVTCRRMTMNPTLDHFKSSEQFNLAFDEECAKQLLTDPTEYLVTPFPSLFNSNIPGSSDINHVVSFVGINDFPIYRSSSSSRSQTGKVNTFHAVLYSLTNKK